ncbi:hypothetical protein ATCC90586_003715 [Pythium insidiosum]|nr:hypothetical protein ATCC90586_003715 [Pythium insidiosum]
MHHEQDEVIAFNDAFNSPAPVAPAASSIAERRRQLAQDLHEHRQDEVLELHEHRSAHYVDNLFSLVTGNMAIVCWIFGFLYISRDCQKPLAPFLLVLGCLAPFAACLPILLRQWFYLHLRLRSIGTIVIFAGSALYVTWLFAGQQWAFDSTAKTCDADLSTATNAVVFVLYLVALLYAAKVVWYLALRVRYSYKQLLLSCLRDPYPDVMSVSDEDFDRLESVLRGHDPDEAKSERAEGASKTKRPFATLLQELQHHQQEVRQSLHRLMSSSPDKSSAAAAAKKKKGPSKWSPRLKSAHPQKKREDAMRCRCAAWVSALALLGAAQAVVQQRLFGLPTGLAYYIEMNIGQPLYSSATANSSKNSFSLLVDTGSSNTAVVTASCCASTDSTLFSCAASSSCEAQDQRVGVNYIMGAWSGLLVTDTFSSSEIGVVPRVEFTAIDQQSNFIQSGYDGIVGLGFQSIASPQSSPPTPYLETLEKSKGIADSFSLLMCGALQPLLLAQSTRSTTVDLYAGELIVGGTQGAEGQTYYQGDIVYTPLVQTRWYNVIVTSVGVGSKRLDVDCKDINTPRAIVDSGTSNVAFPSVVYTAIVDELRRQVLSVTADIPDRFFSDQTPCCTPLCDPTDPSSKLLQLPPLVVSLALSGSKAKSQQISVKIPPEYIWRPILLQTAVGYRACRVFGISEGEITLLGDVFMDGLFTVHDREHKRLGLAVATACPNNVTSTKTVTVESLSPGAGSFCDCVSSADRRSSLLASHFPIGSDKPCFFWIWWMYIVLISFVIIVVSVGVILWVFVQRRRHRRRLEELRAARQQSNGTQRPSYSAMGNRLNMNVAQFGLVAIGRPVFTDFQEVGPGRYLTEIADPTQITDLTFFLLPTSPVPPGFGAVLYFAVPALQNWQLLGSVFAEKPSAILRTGWPTHPDVVGQPVLQLGISIEPIDNVKNLGIEASGLEERKAFALKIAQDLFNFMTSFSTSGTSAYMTIPTNLLDRWMERFEAKYRRDPNFMLKN